MKTLVLSFICFILSLTNSYSQAYESIFGDSITSWSIYTTGIDNANTDSLTTVFDTTFNNYNYKYVQKHYYYGLNGFIREDTNQGKAWFIADYSGATEKLIMDLNLTVGDTFYVNYYGNLIVDSVYYLNNKKHIQFDRLIYAYDINNNYGSKPFTFIEGLGSNAGIIYQHTCCGDYLLCASKDNIQTYSDSTFNGSCDIYWVGINELDNESKWKLAPNPFNEFTVLSVENKATILSKVIIYDIHGRVVKSINNINSHQVKISKDQLQTGIYFFQLYSENKIIASGKILVN